MKNKVLVTVRVENGEVDEVHWIPINFHIYSCLFGDMVEEAAGETEYTGDGFYELIMIHKMEWNGSIVSAEWFEEIHRERDPNV